jgi:hypothetical protein
MADSFGSGRAAVASEPGAKGHIPRSRLFGSATREGSVRGIRHFLRNFTATAVKEHLRSQLEDTGGKPDLPPKEIELVRFMRERSPDWDRILSE